MGSDPTPSNGQVAFCPQLLGQGGAKGLRTWKSGMGSSQVGRGISARGEVSGLWGGGVSQPGWPLGVRCPQEAVTNPGGMGRKGTDGGL